MRIAPVLLSSFLFVVAAPSLGAIRVAVQQDATLTNNTSPDLAAQLADDTLYDFDVTLVGTTGLDSAIELDAYDVVILPGTGNFDNDFSPAMATAIATWATGGRGVITTGWFDYSASDDPLLDALTPTDSDASTTDLFCEYDDLGSLFVTITQTHPVSAGVSSIQTTSQNIEVNPLLDGTNALVLGTGGDSAGCTSSGGTPNAVVVGEIGGGRTVYLGLLYGADPNSYDPLLDLRSGSADQLLEQAVIWAGFDEDRDGLRDPDDNCPADSNIDQANLDADALGDVCDPDLDGDTILNAIDNCPELANLEQDDEDEDGIGDACDPSNDNPDGGGGGGGCGCTLAASTGSGLGAAHLLVAFAALVATLRRRPRSTGGL